MVVVYRAAVSGEIWLCDCNDGSQGLSVNLRHLIPPSHRRRDSTAVLVRHKPQWHRHDSRGSVIDRRSTAENCRNSGPSRLHGGNFEHVQNFRSAIAGLSKSAVGSPRHRHDRRGTLLYKDRSSTAITAVPPQYNRRAIAISRLGTLRRYRGGSTAETGATGRGKL